MQNRCLNTLWHNIFINVHQLALYTPCTWQCIRIVAMYFGCGSVYWLWHPDCVDGGFREKLAKAEKRLELATLMRAANPLTPFDLPSAPLINLSCDGPAWYPQALDRACTMTIPVQRLPNFTQIEIVVSRGALEGWVEQASPACGAASVAGAWNAITPSSMHFLIVLQLLVLSSKNRMCAVHCSHLKYIFSASIACKLSASASQTCFCSMYVPVPFVLVHSACEAFCFSTACERAILERYQICLRCVCSDVCATCLEVCAVCVQLLKELPRRMCC